MAHARGADRSTLCSSYDHASVKHDKLGLGYPLLLLLLRRHLLVRDEVFNKKMMIKR
jgi:hypothetical protein